MFSSRRWWWWCSPWTITLVSGSVLYLLLMTMMMLSLDGPKITSTTNLATMANGHAESRTIISRGKYSIISAADDKRSVHKEGLFLKKFYLLFLPPGTVLRPGFPFGGIGNLLLLLLFAVCTFPFPIGKQIFANEDGIFHCQVPISR